MGGGCFELDGTTSAKIEIKDVTGPPVQGYYDFLEEDGDRISSGTFRDTVSVAIPSSSSMLRVYVDGLGDGLLINDCGVGVAGTISVNYN